MNKRVVLVGNPNCGKTTVFNALTGSNQRVGNWAGVTVEKKTGFYSFAQHAFELIDLPGVYSLAVPEKVAAKDAQITAQVMASGEMDVIVNVVDACHLERQLYLTSQLLELEKPMVIALNMMDIASQRGIQIDTQLLSEQLNCPVIVLQAHRCIGLDALQQAIDTTNPSSIPSSILDRLPQEIVDYFSSFRQSLARHRPITSLMAYMTHRWMEQSDPVVNGESISDLDVMVTDARYQLIHEWVCRVQTKQSDTNDHITAKVDRIVLHRFWGLPIFFSVMYALFFLAIEIGGAFQSGFDVLSKALFVEWPIVWLTQVHAPNWLVAITAYGFGQAMNTMVTFIPVLGIMYVLLSFLEASGYMARAAFLVDRCMRSLGLPGQAFVPMIVGFGCNVPAILAARTMQTERDRYLTVLMNPYMSCSARLAIYAVFVSVFFPNHGAFVIFSLYWVGILMAVLTGFLLRRTIFSSCGAPLLIELPAYHRPTFKRIRHDTAYRLRYFLLRAGRVIVPVCVVLSVLNIGSANGYSSLLAHLGQWLTPIFSPMGIQPDNWPAVVSLLTGVLAKEVLIGTLNGLYLQLEHLNTATMLGSIDVWETLHQTGLVVYDKFRLLFDASFVTDSLSQASNSSISALLQTHFVTPIASYSYLLFVLLYIPCVSTMAAIRQETTRKWMWYSIIWSLLLAYCVAVMFYQIATWTSHSQHWIVYSISLLFLCIILFIQNRVKSGGHRVASAA